MDEKTFFGLSEEVKFCKKCVISNQRPNSCQEFKHDKNSKKETISFNDEGVCDACIYAEKKNNVNWEEREKELLKLLDKHRSTDGSYDCIVPGSGGKDSVYAAHILKYKYDMHPLTVTWAPHMYTDIGRHNFEKWIDAGFDNFLNTPNGKVHKLLTGLAFKNLLHPFQPFVLGQKNLAPKMAALFNIPLVIYGENEAEYGNPISDNVNSMRSEEFYSSEENVDKLLLGGVSVKELKEVYGLKKCDTEPFLPARPEDLKMVGVQVHYLGYYIKWDPQEAYYYAAKNVGFRPCPERTPGTYSKYNSIDDKSDDFHYFTTYIKFGIGRASYDAAQEIRNGKITREEGVALVHRYDGEFPERYFREFLDYIGIDEKEFWETINKFRSPHLWKKTGSNEWVLKHRVGNL